MFYHDEKGSTLVKYNENKRAIKLDVFYIDSPEAREFLNLILRFIKKEANKIEHIRSMAPAKFFALVERFSTVFCYAYSPTKNHNIPKSEIRGAIYFLLLEAVQHGEWPEAYPMRKDTFVQFGGGYRGE